jgi:repressor LexA
MMGRGETFALRVKGTSMRDEGILPGDVVIVERKATARNGQTIVALVSDEATIKTFHRKDGRIKLRPANEALKPIPVCAEDESLILGVVIGVMRYCK